MIPQNKPVKCDYPRKKERSRRFRSAVAAPKMVGMAGTATLGKRIQRYKYVYLLILPAIAFVILYRYVPMWGIVIAFKRYNAFEGILKSPWVGLDHFRRMFTSYTFFRIMRNTVVISMLKILIAWPAPIFFALLLNEIRVLRVKKFVQTISYLPHFLSWVVVAGIVRELLSMRGPVNTVVAWLGGTPELYLTNEALFVPILIASAIWRGVGWGSIVYLSAITGIDPQLYEAAEIDGAGRIQRMYHITVPSIVPVIVILFLLRVGNVLDAGFDQIFNLYNPLVYSVSDIIDTYVYRVGLVDLDFSFATAAGLFKNVLGLIFMLMVNFVLKRQREYGIV
jgi:putative aldouronate transport system permease protein